MSAPPKLKLKLKATSGDAVPSSSPPTAPVAHHGGATTSSIHLDHDYLYQTEPTPRTSKKTKSLSSPLVKEVAHDHQDSKVIDAATMMNKSLEGAPSGGFKLKVKLGGSMGRSPQKGSSKATKRGMATDESSPAVQASFGVASKKMKLSSVSAHGSASKIKLKKSNRPPHAMHEGHMDPSTSTTSLAGDALWMDVDADRSRDAFPPPLPPVGSGGDLQPRGRGRGRGRGRMPGVRRGPGRPPGSRERKNTDGPEVKFNLMQAPPPRAFSLRKSMSQGTFGNNESSRGGALSPSAGALTDTGASSGGADGIEAGSVVGGSPLDGTKIDLSSSKRATKEAIDRLLQRIWDRDHHALFRQPVTDAVAPGYSSIITHPMDLSMMKKKNAEGAYKDWDGVEADLDLMFSNALTYNLEGDTVWNIANKLKSQTTTMLRAARMGRVTNAAAAAKASAIVAARKEKAKIRAAQKARNDALRAAQKAEERAGKEARLLQRAGVESLEDENATRAPRSTYRSLPKESAGLASLIVWKGLGGGASAASVPIGFGKPVVRSNVALSDTTYAASLLRFAVGLLGKAREKAMEVANSVIGSTTVIRSRDGVEGMDVMTNAPSSREAGTRAMAALEGGMGQSDGFRSLAVKEHRNVVDQHRGHQHVVALDTKRRIASGTAQFRDANVGGPSSGPQAHMGSENRLQLPPPAPLALPSTGGGVGNNLTSLATGLMQLPLHAPLVVNAVGEQPTASPACQPFGCQTTPLASAPHVKVADANSFPLASSLHDNNAGRVQGHVAPSGGGLQMPLASDEGRGVSTLRPWQPETLQRSYPSAVHPKTDIMGSMIGRDA